MKGKDFDWQTNKFMLYCRSTQVREKRMMVYEQSLNFGDSCDTMIMLNQCYHVKDGISH